VAKIIAEVGMQQSKFLSKFQTTRRLEWHSQFVTTAFLKTLPMHVTTQPGDVATVALDSSSLARIQADLGTTSSTSTV
jgi:hypothetical protein